MCYVSEQVRPPEKAEVMTERPILFSYPMVRAIINGTKTQTRRVVKAECPPGCDGVERQFHFATGTPFWRFSTPVSMEPGFTCPYGEPGDRLWVRETHQAFWIDDQRPDLDFAESKGVGWRVGYVATAGVEDMHDMDKGVGVWCRPSIHMPRWASRITIELTDVSVERVQNISEDDARAEGVYPIESDGMAHRTEFAILWDQINHVRAPWASNPWVWALTFRKVTP